MISGKVKNKKEPFFVVMRKEDRKKEDPGTQNSLTLDIALSWHFAGERI